ncbi:MAG: hypothetical protein HY611_08125 [Elusimicrobia bacterium]|nr:hypothetical protein [Elusimicrobiota bacterium]
MVSQEFRTARIASLTPLQVVLQDLTPIAPCQRLEIKIIEDHKLKEMVEFILEEGATASCVKSRLDPFPFLPVFVDPSHGVGVRELIPAMACAAVAAGADGLIVEVHRSPTEALSDGHQAILPAQFAQMVGELRKVAAALGRTL